jgi:hypothetical protein
VPHIQMSPPMASLPVHDRMLHMLLSHVSPPPSSLQQMQLKVRHQHAAASDNQPRPFPSLGCCALQKYTWSANGHAVASHPPCMLAMADTVQRLPAMVLVHVTSDTVHSAKLAGMQTSML